MHEGSPENIQLATLGRELLEKFIADEISGKAGTGHFLEGGEDQKKQDKDFHLDDLEVEDFIMIGKVLGGAVTRKDYEDYKKRKKSQQILMSMIDNKMFPRLIKSNK